MLDWWIELPAWVKYGLALLVLGVSTAVYFAGWFWPWSFGVGAALLLAALMFD